jgi:hypothetical protein
LFCGHAVPAQTGFSSSVNGEALADRVFALERGAAQKSAGRLRRPAVML